MNTYYLFAGLCFFFLLVTFNKAFSFEGWWFSIVMALKQVAYACIMLLALFLLYLGSRA